jgi:negative regulator of flagellin synthesis FlgM
MTVRIDPNVPSPNSGTSKRISEAQSAGSARSTDRAGNSASEGMPITSDSANISTLATQLGNFPSVRQERVQPLRQAVQNGSYQVDGEKVAQSILADLQGTGSHS